MTHVAGVPNACLQASQGQGAVARADVLDFTDIVVQDHCRPKITGLRLAKEERSGLRLLRFWWVVNEVRCEAEDLGLDVELNLRQHAGLGGEQYTVPRELLCHCC